MERLDLVLRGISLVCSVGLVICGVAALFVGRPLLASAAFLIAYVGFDSSRR